MSDCPDGWAPYVNDKGKPLYFPFGLMVDVEGNPDVGELRSYTGLREAVTIPQLFGVGAAVDRSGGALGMQSGGAVVHSALQPPNRRPRSTLLPQLGAVRSWH